ncbi:AraC family transcriptional regulator [Actinobacillus equuli subsp. equuli]|uniref:AraC family transcriptional regulator n=1 Tax=Actinobacillus equuli subsp. equuli TaxID=202947 RepID=A0A9X4G2A4_ACTEU|nr:AraC family transcriptional regulator [Actinobacillus equuli]MDE8034477.1 AraC family transcriptional regulator [Actinobacillus equuli subsp. equuli]MDG4947522.1 AraC family transcriptional regulator [Actinobacillus equuli subsp. haemolyticus]
MKLLEKVKPLIDPQKFHHTFETLLPDFHIFHTNKTGGDVIQIEKSGFSVVLQGSKEVQIGEYHYQYRAGDFACYAVDMPILAHYQATPEQPYIDLRFYLPPEQLQQLTEALLSQDYAFPDFSGKKPLSQLSPALEDALCRLIDLHNSPNDIPILYPLLQQEIIYRLLCSEQGGLLRKIATQGSNTQRVASAVEWLNQHYNQPFNVEELSTSIGMSSSGFYAHFRQLTGMSPLQYQKNLRLAQAHRLLKTGTKTISEIAYQVGYDSLPQFSREYKRAFGKTARESLKAG